MEREEITDVLNMVRGYIQSSDDEKFESFFKLGEFNAKFDHFCGSERAKVSVELKIRKIKLNG